MKELLVSTGALVSAFVASLCCIGPLILVGLGLGGAGLATSLAPYRPYFLGLAALFLVGAFYLTYRRPRAACAPGETCARGGPGRMARPFLWVLAAAVVALGVLPYILGRSAPAASEVSQATPPLDLRKVPLEVGGMTCTGCAATVERALRAVPGVQQARVSFEEGRADILVLGTGVANHDLIAAVERAGYRASAGRPGHGRADG